MKKIPQRQCIGCGEMKGKKEMIRVIKTAEGEILLMPPEERTGVERTFAHLRNV